MGGPASQVIHGVHFEGSAEQAALARGGCDLARFPSHPRKPWPAPKARILGLTLRDSESAGLRWDLGTCIPNSFSGDATAARCGATL